MKSMWILITAFGMYLESGEVDIFLIHPAFENQHEKDSPHLIFETKEECDTYLLKDAEQKADNLKEGQKVIDDFRTVRVTRTDFDNYVVELQCIEIKQ